MKLLWGLEKDEYGTPIEKANAVIKNFMETETYPLTSEMYEYHRRELEEFVEHIEVYLKHNRFA